MAASAALMLAGGIDGRRAALPDNRRQDMTVRSKAKRGRCSVAVAYALAAAAIFTAGAARSEQFTMDELLRVGAADAADFPPVLGSRTIRARYQEKRTFTMADGSQQTVFLFRASNCWLRERTITQRAAVDCRGRVGPGVFLAVLFVTPAALQRPDRSTIPDLVLRSWNGNSLADFVPDELLDAAQPYGPPKVTWIRLQRPELESMALSAPAAPAALVLCVPAAAPECRNSTNVMLANLADTPDQTVAAPPAARLPPGPASRPIPAPGLPAPTPPASSGGVARATPAPATDGAPAVPGPTAAQLHYVIRPAAGAMPGDWTPGRMAKRLVALLASTESKFFLKPRDSAEVPSNLPPELTGSGDAVIVWSGDNPQGPWDFIFRGVGLELLPWTQPAESQPTSSSLASPRIRASDYISFAEYRIATPFLYDQWQAGIEVATRVYGREQPYAAADGCRFSLLVPRTGWLSYLTGPISIGLQRTEQAGRSILVSQTAVTSAQLMGAAGEPLQLDVQPATSGQACATDRVSLAPFATEAGNPGSWTVSSVPGLPSTGRMDIRTANLMTPGRWLLGLYGPQNIGAGAEAGSTAASEAQDKIFSSLTAFLADFRERQFQDAQPASAAVGADLALISAADAVSPTFSEKNVITGKLRQPPPQNGLFQIDQEAKRRLSAFLSSPGNTGGEVSFRAVGQMIRRYSDLFGNLAGPRPPIAVYVGAARPIPGTCPDWKKMTADTAMLPGRPRVFAVVFANTTTDEIAQQLGQNGYGGEEILGGQTRALTCEGDGGSMLLFVPFPHLILRTPETVLRPAFETVERWALKVQN
jgi:hypothetical protein